MRDRTRIAGYTTGTKTAISVPDDVFERAERLAGKTRKSRSELFSDAMREYIARHASEEVTEAMDRVCVGLSEVTDAFSSVAARRILQKSYW
jgi:metal-responsive CopG/Arc/MetJ family transcriptional regulator